MSRSRYVNESVPIIRHSRSRFDLSKSLLTSMNVGDLVPIYAEEVYPGDTFIVRENHVIRATSAFLRPVMDNAFVDVRFFYVPYRLLMPQGEWEEFWGYSDQPWITSQPSYDTVLPSVRIPSQGNVNLIGTLGDYFGDIPFLPSSSRGSFYSNISGFTVKQFPYRAYAKIVNDWFRGQATDQAAVVFPEGTPTLNSEEWSPNNIFGKPFVVDKMHDYFTNATPSPQLGSAVNLPLGLSAPVTVNLNGVSVVQNPNATQTNPSLYTRSGAPLQASSYGVLAYDSTGDLSCLDSTFGQSWDRATEAYVKLGLTPNSVSGTADLSQATAANVNDLRFAFQLQKLLERNIYGVRYTEYIRNHFGVSAGDSRLQRSEYLGGSRNPIHVQQVTNTTITDNDTSAPLGELGAFSLSGGRAKCSKSFVEHGIILGLACIRQYHTYSQGIPKWHRRLTRNQFYDPLFANIGNQPIYQWELYAGGNATSDSVFGYNEAFADMRIGLNNVTGAMRPGVAGLDVWHFADNYSSAPVLNSSFLKETSAYIDRTLAVEPTNTSPAFIVNCYFDVKAVRPLPTYSLPGLIDHH